MRRPFIGRLIDRLGLDALSTSVLSGMLTTLIALPFDMMGTRLLFWTWHAGDPRTVDR